MIAGVGTPESYVAAFDSAIAKGPDVILGAAAPGALVGDRLDLAADAGIITISLADLPEPDPDALAAYDAYVSLRSPLLGRAAGLRGDCRLGRHRQREHDPGCHVPDPGRHRG